MLWGFTIKNFTTINYKSCLQPPNFPKPHILYGTRSGNFNPGLHLTRYMWIIVGYSIVEGHKWTSRMTKFSCKSAWFLFPSKLPHLNEDLKNPPAPQCLQHNNVNKATHLTEVIVSSNLQVTCWNLSTHPRLGGKN